jgi:uncharacterized protein YuzE
MRKKDGLISQRIEDGLILYDPQADEAYVLNETAALVWENAELPEEEIAVILSERYDVGNEEALEDARAFIAELVGKGLLLPS